MRTKRFFLIVVVFIGLLLLVRPAWAALVAQETPLNAAGLAFELNRDSQGLLWVSDSDPDAGEIWRFDPGSWAYSIYTVGGGPSDARSDGAGAVWWADFASNKLGRLTTASGNVDIWEIPESAGLYTTAIDGAGHIWVTDFFTPNLYELDPGSNNLCVYALPDRGMGSYMAAAGQYLWLGDYSNERILRIDTTSGEFTWWPLAPGSYPLGIAVDGAGQVWWAEVTHKVVGRLDPAGSLITTFDPPATRIPQMVTIKGEQVWLSLQSSGPLVSAGVGVMLPSAAAGQDQEVASKSQVIEPLCSTLTPKVQDAITPSNGTASWSGQAYPTAADDQAGWVIFASPPGSTPYGVASAAEFFMVDQGRHVLSRMSLSAPAIQVEKVPSLASVPETGADVTFTFTVTNTSNELPLTITSLVDDAFGNLDGDADCQLGTRLAAGAFCAFSSIQEIKGDFSGPDHSNTFTAHAKDPFQTDVLDNVLATVAFTDTLPTLLVEKTPSVDSVVETGAEVTFTFKVTNTSGEPVTILSLSDSVFLTLAGDADCQVGTQLAAGAFCDFAITRLLEGSASGPAHHNVFTALAEDNEGNDATDDDDATVTFTAAQVKYYVYLPLIRR